MNVDDLVEVRSETNLVKLTFWPNVTPTRRSRRHQPTAIAQEVPTVRTVTPERSGATIYEIQPHGIGRFSRDFHRATGIIRNGSSRWRAPSQRNRC